jgi:hypothetical protein
LISFSLGSIPLSFIIYAKNKNGLYWLKNKKNQWIIFIISFLLNLFLIFIFLYQLTIALNMYYLKLLFISLFLFFTYGIGNISVFYLVAVDKKLTKIFLSNNPEYNLKQYKTKIIFTTVFIYVVFFCLNYLLIFIL